MLALFAALVCVLANGFFVAAEFALVKVRPTALEARAAAGDRKAILGLEAIRNLDAYLGATQLGITLASLALGWLGEPAISIIVEPALMDLGLPESAARPIGLAIAFAIITLLHIVMGELAPKSLAIQYADKVVLLTARVMHAFHSAAYPFLYVLNGSANLLLRAFGLGTPDHASGAPSAEELRLIVQTSFRAGGLDGTQRDLLERVLRGSGRSVRAIMVPRVDMSVLSIEADLTTTEARMRREAYSRYPLSENNDPDRIVGYLYAKDVWTAPHPQRGRLDQLRRDILFVPESRTVAEMLEDFRTSHTPIAIVVDEYGGTSGLVTLEDCVEEIVGDIRDETDDEPVRTLIRPDGSVVVDGGSPFADLEVEELRDLVQDQDETVGAFVIERLGRLPKPGDRVRIGEYEAVVEVVRRRRVSRVVFRVAEKAGPDALTRADG
ncbi:MAG: Magnesium and cobalt efflux protein CorC [Myxococcaceae bacterium]|nr:Magnesium and cobalt efflux protein CorC [Myxococcaceae bacterium]